MSLFLLTFLMVYGSVHLYFFLKVRVAFGLGGTAAACLGAALGLLVIAPILVRVLEREGMEQAARLAAYAGYAWMGFLFLFFSSSLAIDAYHGLLWTTGVIFRRDCTPLHLPSRTAVMIPLVWGIAISMYGSIEARSIKVERISLTSPKLPPGRGPLTVVQISDVHLGLMVGKERLAMILARINAVAPDILVSTGDLVDGQINGLAGLAELLQEINPRYGKFAVTGNHESYAGLKQSENFMRRAGFKVLRGEEVTIPDLICIAGVDDPAVHRAGTSASAEERELVDRLAGRTFTILLKHRPVVARETQGHIDLQLSGHVHKGQIFPFNLATYLFYPVKAGLTMLHRHTGLYVSRGTGTWGPPIRFLAPPEITVFELSHGPGA